MPVSDAVEAFSEDALEPPKPLAKELAFGYRCHSLWSLSPGGLRLRFASSRLRQAGSGLCPIPMS